MKIRERPCAYCGGQVNITYPKDYPEIYIESCSMCPEYWIRDVVPNLEDLGLTEEDVEEFGKAFLKNIDELAEIDE